MERVLIAPVPPATSPADDDEISTIPPYDSTSIVGARPFVRKDNLIFSSQTTASLILPVPLTEAVDATAFPGAGNRAELIVYVSQRWHRHTIHDRGAI